MEAIEHGVNSFLETSAVLMKTLDEVGKLHPFIGVAVMAFKAVYTLEMKRRENDKRIIALHVEMKDTMGMLMQLKEVKDADEIAPDGTTIKGRLGVLVNQTAQDIKDCANACDTYSKKKLLVKVLNGPVWEGRLVKFVGIFTQRRSEFQFALSIHTAQGIDSANKTISDVDQTTRDMNTKMDMMMKMFQRFVTADEKEMTKIVQQKGGAKACQKDDLLLQELSDLEPKQGVSVSGGPAAGRKSGAKNSDLEDLKDELHLDPEAAIKKNMSVFSRKFEVQQRQLLQEMSLVVKREGDRVISAVTAGPHDKIIDPDVHQIWKEMGWRGSVKARHFVMALRDHFHDKWGTERVSTKEEDALSVLLKSDEWALAFLSVVRLQPVSEAFDDDASGFVTIAEVNTFTTSRPLGWSLPHWLAYWAVGFHQTLCDYASKIGEIMAKMFTLLPKILPANLPSANEYLSSVYVDITSLQNAVGPSYLSDALQTKFKSYIEAEEERLKGNLEAIHYDIDASDTLALITGPGRIERFVFPLLYLLLKRHFEIFRIGLTNHLHPNELDDAADTIRYVFEAVHERMKVLTSMFRQQKLDLTQEFQTFAHGLFAYHYEPSGLWAPNLVRALDFVDPLYDDSMEAQGINPHEILNYDMDMEERDLAVYDIIDTPAAPEAPSFDSELSGIWHGFTYVKWDTDTASGMISMDFNITSREDEQLHFQASGRSDYSDFSIKGRCTPGDTGDLIVVTFTRTFPLRYPAEYWHGQLDKSTDTISGTCGHDLEHDNHFLVFVLKRMAPEYLRFRPAPEVFDSNKARALWSFALSAIQYQVRRQSWSWGFFQERREKRSRFIKLYIRQTEFGRPLDPHEYKEFVQLRGSFTSADSRFYHSLAHYQIRRTTKHAEDCDNCHGTIGGARIICLVCQGTESWHPVDLCETPECVSALVDRKDLARPHLPTHDVFKVRRVAHIRQFGKLYREAKVALQKARAIFQRTPPPLPLPRQGSTGNNAAKVADVVKQRASTVAKPLPKCAICKATAAQPCWYCVHCEGDMFICINCDAKGTVKFGNHDDTHALVRCQPLVADVETSLEDRLTRVEKLLESVLQKFGIETTSDGVLKAESIIPFP
ncbi:hypothetical protein K439DRAFT_202072 [Ramaria rubella]|nr:hypothetical protein K439DRAFT_202072 [Ramaria rubella]